MNAFDIMEEYSQKYDLNWSEFYRAFLMKEFIEKKKLGTEFREFVEQKALEY